MPEAILVLEDGRTFRGESFGSLGEAFGTIAVSTAVFEYQEILASPEHSGHIVLFTTPHIGGTGWNDDNPAAQRVSASGIIVRDPVPRPSNWQASRGLQDALAEQGTVGIAGIDTRALTRHLRAGDTTRAAISSTDLDPSSVLQRLQQSTAGSVDGTSGKEA